MQGGEAGQGWGAEENRLEQKRELWLDEGHRGRFMAGKVGIPEKRVVALRLAGASWGEVNSDARRATRLSWFRRNPWRA